MDGASSSGNRRIEIDFVDENSRVHASCKLADRTKIPFRGQSTTRVVEVGDDHEACALGETRGELIEVNGETMVRMAVEPLDLRAEKTRRCQKRLVGRPLDQHLIAGRD